MRGWPTPLGATLNSAQGLYDDAGEFKEKRDAWQVTMVAQQVVDFARRWVA